MNLVKTQMLIKNDAFDIETGGYKPPLPLTTKTPDLATTTTSTNSTGGFWSGVTLNGLLDTIVKGGATWAQIKSAEQGNPVYVQNSEGQKENITPILISKLEQQAQAQQTSTNKLLQMMQMQMQLNNEPKAPPKKDYTPIYIGIGAVAFVGVLYVMNK